MSVGFPLRYVLRRYSVLDTDNAPALISRQNNSGITDDCNRRTSRNSRALPVHSFCTQKNPSHFSAINSSSETIGFAYRRERDKNLK
ncbi:MAG: hypothetical protein A2173_04960 [Planctomycetes bacterium RBG_13_44_8b]|nr:MAG: hypothetical protein A2173_04960 [Planctomycetes bacterium RBG_13_44_8b]